jgi:hypothetical protein
MTFQEKLTALRACSDARQWVGDKTFEQAWNDCKNPDWMLWLVDAMSLSNDKDLRLMAVAFARKVQHLMGDPKSIAALDVAERFANGAATQEELDAARDAAWDAARDAARAAAWDAARDAAWDAARDAAWDAARDAAWDAARAAAWDAARAAAWDAAWDEQCDIIRNFVKPDFSQIDIDAA